MTSPLDPGAGGAARGSKVAAAGGCTIQYTYPGPRPVTDSGRGRQTEDLVRLRLPGINSVSSYFPEDLLARCPRDAGPAKGAILTSDGANSRHPP